jgi:hypothetical protein
MDPLVLTGDVNIHTERSAVDFSNLLLRNSLVHRVQGITQNTGGTLDVVCTRDDQPSSPVAIHDVGVPDHRMLCWTSNLQRPIYATSTCRTWRCFSADLFRDLRASALCDERL